MKETSKTPISDFQIRKATCADTLLILSFIRELAEYEKLLHEMTATESQLEATLFGEKPSAEVVIAEYKNKPVGFALFFHNYSTFLAKPGIYLEDLYITPEFRGHGFGKVLLSYLAKIAVERGCGRFEWSVLDWNTSAIKVYEKIGAEPMNEWTVQRVTGKALTQLAESFKEE